MKTALVSYSSLFVVTGIFMSTLGSIPTSLTGCMGHWGDLTGSMGRTSLEEREGRRTELDTACAFICLTWQLCIELTVLSVHSPEHSYCNELYSWDEFSMFVHWVVYSKWGDLCESGDECAKWFQLHPPTYHQGTPNFTTPVRRGRAPPGLAVTYVCARDY